MWGPRIAEQLRQRGHDAQAVTDRLDLRRRPDNVIFAAAQAEGRVIVTKDVSGFRRLANQCLAEGDSHAGVIFTIGRAFARDDSGTVGRLVTALDHLLSTDPVLENLEYWLS